MNFYHNLVFLYKITTVLFITVPVCVLVFELHPERGEFATNE